MQIGKLVQGQAGHIFRYCQDHPEELSLLMDKDYSNRTFKLNWPFCLKESSVPQKDREEGRYWSSMPFTFNGNTILVCSQWYARHRGPFCKYLAAKGIIGQDELPNLLADGKDQLRPQPRNLFNISPETTKIIKGRYKATADGDAANLVIRAILSSLGTEPFTRYDWEETKK